MYAFNSETGYVTGSCDRCGEEFSHFNLLGRIPTGWEGSRLELSRTSRDVEIYNLCFCATCIPLVVVDGVFRVIEEPSNEV